jgi:hypothetical protein
VIRSPGVLGNLAVGVQFYQAGGVEVRVDYTLRAGEASTTQGASGRVALHF